MKSNLNKAFFTVLSVAVTSTLVVIILNLPLFDERLSEEIEGVRAQQAVANEANNAYVWLAGFASTEDGAPYALGKIALERAFSHQANAVDANEHTADEAWPKSYQALTCSTQLERGCHYKLAEELQTKPISNPRISQLMERYKQLIQAPELKFHSTMSLEAHNYSVAFGLPLKIQRLYLANALLPQSKENALNMLAIDLAFWRSLLANADTILVKMVSTAAIFTNLQAISEFIAAMPAQAPERITVYREILTAFNTQEMSFLPAFVGELSHFNAVIPAEYFSMQPTAWFSQHNASVNLAFLEYYKPWSTHATLAAGEYHAKIAQCKASDVPNEMSCLLGREYRLNPFAMLYNPLGKVLADLSSTGLANYISRVYDLNGLMLLINAQLSLKEHTTTMTQQDVDQLPYINPYTNAPFRLDANTKRLSFECLSDKPFCDIAL